MLLHEFPACDKSGIFLVKLFLDDIRKIINKWFSLKDKAKAIRMAEDMLAERKGYVKDFVGGTISVMCKETKEEVWSKPIGEV